MRDILKSSALLVPLAYLLASCGGSSDVLRIVDVVNADGSYGLKDVQVTTLRDLTHVRGGAATFYGGSHIDLTHSRQILDKGGSRDSIVVSSAAVETLTFVDDGVVVSCDFDTLMMLTAYAHFEEALNHFEGIGASFAAGPPPVDYDPAIDGGSAYGFPNTDNAAFFALTDSFVLLPMSIFQDIPFPMNAGVIAHEMSHRVFYYRAWQGQLFTALDAHQSDLLAQNNFNRAKSTDEGLADFFAACVTGDPVFLGKSMAVDSPGQYASIWQDRDLTQPWILNAGWLNGDAPLIKGAYNPYPAGTVLAAALWTIGQEVGLTVTEEAVAAAEIVLSSQLLDSFTYSFGDIESEIVRQLPTTATAEACAVFLARDLAIASRFAGVCP